MSKRPMIEASMKGNPKRRRVLLLIVMGLASVAAWLIIFFHDPVAKGRGTAAAGLAVTLLMIGVLVRSYITRRGIATAVLVLSLLSLALGIVAMVILTF